MRPFKNILYVSEPSVNQESAIARAATLAQNNQAKLTVMDVVPEQLADISMLPEEANAATAFDLTEAAIAGQQQSLKTLLAPYLEQLEPEIEVRVGKKFLEVIKAVLRYDYDLVIKPSEDPDWIDRLFGSEDMHLLRKCPCPVWLMKPEEKNNYQCIVAAVDFNPHDSDPDDAVLNEAILGLAGSVAFSDFASLHLVHAWDASQAGFASLWSDKPELVEMKMSEAEYNLHAAGMDKLTRKLRELIGEEAYNYLSPRIHMPKGSARTTIPALVKQLQADLVVMGTVARTGIPGFIIGNTAESILDQLNCSVLALKPPGFVSPVTLE